MIPRLSGRKAKHLPLLVPVLWQAIIVHQLAGVQLGRVLAREDFDGDVRRKPGQSDQAGDIGGGQALLPGDIGQGDAAILHDLVTDGMGLPRPAGNMKGRTGNSSLSIREAHSAGERGCKAALPEASRERTLVAGLRAAIFFCTARFVGAGDDDAEIEGHEARGTGGVLARASGRLAP